MAGDPRMEGMKKQQRQIAHEIRDFGPTTLRRVAKILCMDTNGVSQSSNALFRRGLIEMGEQQGNESFMDREVRWVPGDQALELDGSLSEVAGQRELF